MIWRTADDELAVVARQKSATRTLEDGRQKVYLTAALEGKLSKRYYPTHHDQDYAYVAIMSKHISGRMLYTVTELTE